MPASNASLNLAARWQPVSECFSKVRSEFSGLANCAESVLGEVEAVHRELLEHARELTHLEARLAEREGQLSEQRIEHARLVSQFEQQEARLLEAVEEVRHLREELSRRQTPETLAADSARLAMDQAREAWERERGEVLERLNALTLMQQTGTNDSEAVTAFCRELSEIRQFIEGTQQETRQALQTSRSELFEQITSLAKASETATQSQANFDDLRGLLHDLAGQVANWQLQAAEDSQRDEFVKRLDALVAAQNALAEAHKGSSDEAVLLDSLVKQLAETKSLVETVRSAADFDDLRGLLHDLAGQVANWQLQASENSQRDELVKRLDALVEAQNSLAEAQKGSSDEAALLDSLVKQLAETKALVEGVRSASEAEAPDYEAIIRDLHSEVAEMRIAAQQAAERSGAASAEQETIARLREEAEASRQLAATAREQAQRQEQERLLVETELDRLRTQAAQWRRDLEEATARHHEEERSWREELQELRQIVQQAAQAMADGAAPPAPASKQPASKQPASKPAAEASEPADAVASNLMAQFAKLQKDSARRRTRGGNS
jgi:hypothetical protein